VIEAYDEREEELGDELMRALERFMLLQIIDERWREHLHDMDYLREGIHLRGFAQIDPLVAYKNEGFKMFEELMASIWEEFARVIDINLNGCYWMAQSCGRVMQPGSSIINISSVLGLTTAALPQAAYASSKAGLIGMTRDLAQQWTGRKGIRVNALAPGFFESEMTDQYPDGYLDSMRARHPAGRAGDPAELVAAASAIRKALGWKPRHPDLETIVRHAIRIPIVYARDAVTDARPSATTK